MSESTEQLLHKLEQATSAEPTTPLDDDTAMLRESWVAFGKLLDAADDGSVHPEACIQLRRPSALLWRFFAALAASSLVAVATWAILNGDSTSTDPSLDVAKSTEHTNDAPPVDNIATSPTDEESSQFVDEFAWEDSFDEQLAATSEAIRSVQADWNGSDRRYSVLLDQFEEFSDEMSEGSL